MVVVGGFVGVVVIVVSCFVVVVELVIIRIHNNFEVAMIVNVFIASVVCAEAIIDIHFLYIFNITFHTTKVSVSIMIA